MPFDHVSPLFCSQEKCQDDISRVEREFIAKQADLDRQISKAEKTREAELKRLDAELAVKLQVLSSAVLSVVPQRVVKLYLSVLTLHRHSTSARCVPNYKYYAFGIYKLFIIML